MEIMQPIERAERIIKDLANHPRAQLGSVQWGILTQGIEADRQDIAKLILARCKNAKHEACDCRTFAEVLVGRPLEVA